MEKDLNQIPAGTTLKADLCIIGSGPAGITLARQWIGRGKKVLLLESGGYSFSDETQALNQAAIEPSSIPNIPPPNYPSFSRARYFGGASNLWGGWCRPFEKHDFDHRSWVPNSGWPITRDTLEGYYGMAADILKIARFKISKEESHYVPGSDRNFSQMFKKPIKDPEVMPRYFQLTDPGSIATYKGELVRSENVEIVTNANLTRFDIESAGTKITSARVVNQKNQDFEIIAKVYVLACGGLENSRILLNSHAQRAQGIGNQNGLVGKYFMEHPHANFALFANQKGNSWIKPLLFESSGKVPFFVFTTSYEFQQKNKTLNFCATLDKNDLKLPEEEKVLNLAKGSGVKSEHKDTLHFFVRSEMEPIASNAVKLTSDTDRFGVKKLSLGFTYSDKDRISIKKSMQAMLRFLSYHEVGRGKLNMAKEDDWPDPVSIGCHQLGGTRMANSASQGVVDGDCKVFGTDNLYIAGSSVFPTGGFANPTLTIIALAFRLAETLRGRV